MKRNYLHAYAIVRYESGSDDLVPIDLRITVKKVVFDPRYAEAEAKRLNDLNRDKGCYYFSQITRIEQPSADAEAVASVDLAAGEYNDPQG